MRTIRFFVTSLLLGLFLALFAFLILREALLYMATQQMKEAVNEMDKISRSGVEVRQQCAQLGGTGIRTIQTRFINSTKYQIEAICEFGSNDPIVVQSEVLPLWVKKVPGESGLIWDERGVSGVAFEIFGRESTVVLDANELEVTQGKKEFLGNKPAAMCAGYGYMCCDPVTSIGQGTALSQAMDCGRDCYVSCQARPVVLRFYADPAPDARTKTISLTRGSAVSYYYTIDPGDQKSIQEVVIDFGDGQLQQFTEKEGLVTHTYECAMAQCLYTATVVATDNNGNSSIITPVSTLQVQVQ